jgi:LAO/AO transport system kinase
LRKTYDIETLIQNFKNKDKVALAKLITLVENEPDKALEIFKHFDKSDKDSYIIGITGSPGVGKSTLINILAKQLLDEGKSVGVISVDPSSPFSGGAFLGDRVRMTEVSLDPNIFIRSLASRGHGGGISRAVFDISLLYEAFGMDVIIIETVGVGQSEVDIYNLTYTTVVIMVPGYGDSIQIQKAGIIEVGDIYVVNKKDLGGEDIVVQLEMMLDDATVQTGWRPPALMTNSISGEGIDKLVEKILEHKNHLELSEALKKKKKNRFEYKIRNLLTYKVGKVLESLISEEEREKISNSILEGGKYKIYDLVHDLFRNIKFEKKKESSK